MATHEQKDNVLSLLKQELAPYPGRLTGSLLDTLGIIIAVVVTMTLRVPGIHLALALLYLMRRERPGLTLRIGFQIFCGSIIACLGSFFWVQLTDGTDIARFFGIVFCVFTSAFCMASTTVPLLWTIVGFYGFIDLAAWDAHQTSNAIVTASLYNIAALGIVVLSTSAVEYVFGTRHPGEDLEKEFAKRLRALGDFFKALGESAEPSVVSAYHLKLIQYGSDLYLNQLYDQFRDSMPDPSRVPLGMHYRIGLLTRILSSSIVVGFNRPKDLEPEQRRAYLSIAILCDALIQKQPLPTDSFPEDAPYLTMEIERQLRQYAEVGHKASEPFPTPPSSSSTPPSSELFLPGSFDSPDVAVYALKLTLAATICYIIYNAVAWPGILTCVITVLFTGLSSTGAMKQKQLYRFSGAMIGGSLGILAVSVFYPNMDSITSLILLISPVAFLAGWVLRSSKLSYIGVQIGFGFFLTVLPGFQATTRISPARDRVIGVALGILVMWFIFDQIWPVRTTDALRNSLLRIQKATTDLYQLLRTPEEERDHHTFQKLRMSVSLELANVQHLGFSANFEVGRHRNRELARTRRLMEQIERSAARFYSVAVLVYPG